jgi:hypothetical protein
MRRLLLLFVLLAPATLEAGDIKIKVSVHLSGWWWPFAPRPQLGPSPHHIGAAPEPAKDSCTFVAGVRHCPRAEPR